MIWNIAHVLRDSVDARDFKQYVPGMHFYHRYISQNITAYINAGEHEIAEYVRLRRNR